MCTPTMLVEEGYECTAVVICSPLKAFVHDRSFRVFAFQNTSIDSL